jgi:hypothetical protein
MGLPKGRTNNPTGRPKGSKNVLTEKLRNDMTAFLSGQWEQIQQDFKDLEPRERILLYEKLLQYTMPKLQSLPPIDDLQEVRIVVQDETEKPKLPPYMKAFKND